jgi:site-specific recombinase XerD
MAKNGRAKRGKIEGPRSSTTVKTYTIVVKAFFNWAVDRGLIEESPVRRLKRQTLVVRTRVQEFLTEAHREILLKAEAPEGIRFILHFGFFQGLRDSEMLAMTADWLWIAPDWNSGTVTVKEQEIIYQNGNKGWWKPKTREMRTIPLHPRVLEFLKSYGMRRPWMLRPANERWPNPGMQSKRYDAHKTMERLGKKAGVPKLNYHILRHSFATHLVMKGVTLADVAGLLGDTLSVTEKNYAGYSPSLANPLSVL